MTPPVRAEPEHHFVEHGGEESDLALGRKLDLDFAAVLDEVMFRLDMSDWGHVATVGDTSP